MVNLLKVLEDFKNGDDFYDGVMFVVKVKENSQGDFDMYDTYFTVSFSVNDEYRDVFVSSALLYHNNPTTLLECVDEHEDDYRDQIQKGLYEIMNQLEVQDITKLPFCYDYRSGTHDFEPISVTNIEIKKKYTEKKER